MCTVGRSNTASHDMYFNFQNVLNRSLNHKFVKGKVNIVKDTSVVLEHIAFKHFTMRCCMQAYRHTANHVVAVPH